MTAAEDRREELEAEIRRRVRGIPPAVLGAIMASADAYAKAAVRAAREPRPSVPQPPAVHLAAAGARSACRPHDLPSHNWATTQDPADVTCGHCRKTPAWSDATMAAALEDRMPGGAP